MVSRSVNIIEVEVDTETGSVELTNSVLVNDIGWPIGPETVEGQMYGGAIMGYSTGATEEVVYDPSTGIRLNPNWLDYKILTILDAPPISYKMVTSRMGYGAYGSCGCGEDTCTFGSPMVIPAIYNAIGKWVDTYPPTPERVLKALGKA
jgi:CO/xanthine dehydrogenase Mo-binding subunit